jgi:hypothetical protein
VGVVPHPDRVPFESLLEIGDDFRGSVGHWLLQFSVGT